MDLASAIIPASLPAILMNKNPCAIPEKGIHKELERRKHYYIQFSGENVSMQVQCGSQLRVMRSAVLDYDLFDSAPRTQKIPRGQCGC